MTDALDVLLVLGAFCGLLLLVAPFLDRTNLTVRWLACTFTLAVGLRYIWWRTTATLPPFTWTAMALFQYSLWILELVGLHRWLVGVPRSRHFVDRSPEVESNLDWYGDEPPRVAVLIPTYNESWPVLEKTLVGATSLEYPNYSIWLLDDGRREWLREKSEAAGVGYITRSDNAHYKAGNVNNGLRELRERGENVEFIALFDADFIARPQFLRRTLALMKNPKLGIVQTPQWFYNPDFFQRAFGGQATWADEQRYWFDVDSPAYDAVDLAICCGTSCLIRLRALDAIGGLPTETVSEDMQSTLKMWRKGFKTRYLNERLSLGLAPEGLGEYLTQRARWYQGVIEVARYWGPRPGILGRLDYWASLWKMLVFSVVRLGWMLAIVIYWYTGTWVLEAPVAELLIFIGPIWIDRVIAAWLSSGRKQIFVADVHYLLQSVLHIRVVLKNLVFSGSNEFKVTDKGMQRSGVMVHWATLRWLLLLGVPLALGVLYNIVDPSAPGYLNEYKPVHLAWSAFLLIQIALCMHAAIEAPRLRSDDRYETTEPVVLLFAGRRVRSHCRDLSLGGVLVESGNLELPSRVTLELANVGPIQARVVRQAAGGLTAFEFESPEQRPALIRKLFFSDDYVPIPERYSLTDALAGVLRRALSWPMPRGTKARTAWSHTEAQTAVQEAPPGQLGLVRGRLRSAPPTTDTRNMESLGSKQA